MLKNYISGLSIILLTVLNLSAFGQAVTTTYSTASSTAGTYTVPATGCTQIVATLNGAAGGNFTGVFGLTAAGGAGGSVVCTVNVTASQVIDVFVGGIGSNPTAGVGGCTGGAGGNSTDGEGTGGGGGGSSELRISPYGVTNKICVAAGGAGAGGGAGGAGGTTGVPVAGATGSIYANGTAGTGGTQTAGGTGNATGTQAAGGAGTAAAYYGAGGGGGGYWGGGGGKKGTGFYTGYGNGGGGGSNYVGGSGANTVSAYTSTRGSNTGSGSVIICPVLTSIPSAVLSGVSLSATYSTITASFTSTGSAAGFIVVASATAGVVTPTAGQLTTVGTAVPGGGTIIGVGAASPITSTGALVANTNYYITIIPYNGNSCSSNVFGTGSTPALITTCPNPTGTPTTSGATGSSLTVSWTTPAIGGGAYTATTYTYTLNVYSNAALTTLVASYPGVTSGYNVTGLGGGTEYWFTVTVTDPACSTTSATGNGTTLVVPCSGTPSAGAATTTSSLVITTTTFTLGLSGASGATGLTYQWQSSACGAPGGTWTNVTGGTTATFTTSETTSLFYRCQVTCTASTSSSFSTPVYVGYISAAYCNPTRVFPCNGSEGYGDEVNTFTLTGECGTAISDVNLGCPATVTTSRITESVSLIPGNAYTGTINSVGTDCSAFIWIDFNNDGVFEASELVWSNTSNALSTKPATSPVSFTMTSIASGATYGEHRMRVMVIYDAISTTGCPSEDWVQAIDYIANVIPSASLSSNSPLCVGGTLTLTALPNVTCGSVYTWSGPNFFSTATYDANTTIVSTSTPATDAGSYSVSVSANGLSSCATAPGTTTVVVNAAPSLTNATNTSPICAGSLLTLNANGASNVLGYSWTGPVAITGATSATATVPLATTAASGTYTVTVNNGTGSGCSVPYTTIATVNPIPTTSVTPTSATYCAGGGPGITATASGTSSGYTWAPSSGLSCTACSVTIATPAASTVYTVTGSSLGCSSIATLNIAAGVQPTVNLSPVPLTRCSADAGNLLTASGVSTSYTWSPATALSATTGATVTANPTSSITYTITGTNGACSATNTMLVSVNPTPTVSSITSSPTNGVCFSSSSISSVNFSYSTTNSPNNYALTWPAGSGLPNVSAYSSLTSPIGVTVPAGTLAAVYSGTVTVENSTTGCASNGIATLVVNALPIPSFTDSAGTTACTSVIVAYATQPGMGLYEWNFPGGETEGVDYTFTEGGYGNDSIYVQWLTTGPKTISIDYYSAPGNCTAVTPTSNTVNIIASPTATTSSSSPLCATGTVTLTATPSGATSFVWMGSDGFSSTLQNPVETPTVTGTITYSLTVSNAGCSPTTVYITSVTVNPTPSSTGPLNSGPICVGGTVALTANSNSSTTIWAWSGSDGSSSGLQNPIESPTTTVTYSLMVSSTGSGCQPATVYSTTVTVNQDPTSSGPGNTSPLCLGGTVGLTANSSHAITWSWTGSDGSASTVQNPVFTPTVTGTITYSLTMTNGTASGCNPGTVYITVVTVNPTPVASVNNNGPICVVGSATLTATPSGGANTYLWSGPGLSSTVAQDPVATPTVTSTYSLTVSNSGGIAGCSPTTVYTTTVTVNNPTAVVHNNGPICSVATVTLTATPSGGVAAYLWSGPSLSSTTVQDPTATPTVTSTYSLTVSLPGCSPATIYTTQVTVTPAPTAGPTNSGAICNSGTVTLNANQIGGATGYSWSGPNLSSSTVSNPTATPTVTSTYSLTVSSAGCFPSTIFTTIVTVNPLPTAAPMNNGPICLAGTVTLSANPIGSTDIYLWSGPGLSSTTVQNPTATPASTSTYTLIVSSDAGNSGCTPGTMYTTTVTVNSVAAATPTQNGPICTTGTVDLFANPVGGTASVFTWSGTSLSSSSIANPTATPPLGNNTYTLTVSAPGCTASTYTIAVTVNPQATLSGLTSTASNPFCGGGSMTLSVTPSGGAGNSTYTWSGPGIITTASTVPDTAFTTATGAATGAYSVTLAYSASGCLSTSTVGATTYTLTAQPSLSGLSSSSSNPFCTSGVITLSVTPTGGSGTSAYTWTGPGISSATGTSVNTLTSYTTSGGASAGSYSVTLVDNGTGCNPTSATSATVYTMTAQPSLSGLGSNSSNPFCSDGVITLSVTPTGGSGAFTYTWTGPGISSATGTSANTLASYATSGTPTSGSYSVALVDNGTGCNSTSTVSAIVYTMTAQPSLSGLSSNSSNPFCTGGVITLSVTPTGGSGTPAYTWTGPGISSATGTSVNTLTSYTTSGGASAGSYSVTLVDNGTGCSPTSATSATVYTMTAQPSLSGLSSNSSNPFCASAVITLSVTPTGGSGPFTYTWTGPGISSATGTSANTLTSYTTSGGASAGSYSVTLVDNGMGCNATSATSATVYTMTAQPVVGTLTASPTNPFCVEAVLTFTVSGSTGGAGSPIYTWSGPDIAITTGSSNISPSIPTSGGAASGAYSVTLGYTGTGCSTTSPAVTAVYNITLQPTVSALVSSATNPLCIGGTMTLTATSGGGAGSPVYAWSGPDIASATSLSNDMAFTTSGGAASGAYSVTVTYSGTGCTSSPFATGIYSVNIQPSITSVTTPNSNPFCAETTLILTSSISGGSGIDVYTWSGPGIPTTTGTLDISPTFDPSAGVGAYSLALTDNGTGCNATAASTVGTYTVLAAPVTTTVTTTDAGNIFCGSEVINANNSGSGIIYFQGTNAVGTSTLTPANTATVTATGTYYFNAQNAAGCWGIAGSVTITINPIPSAAPTNTGYICVGGTVTLNAGAGANTTNFTWTGPSIISGGATATAMANPTITGANTYSLTVSDGSGDPGCSPTIVYITVVTVNATPTATAGNTGYICNGGTVTLNETGVTSNVANYIWNGTAIVSGSGSPTATADPSTVGTTIYTLTVNDGSGNSGCSSQSMTTVTVNITPSATATNNGYICNGGTVTLNETGVTSNVANYIWNGTAIVSGSGSPTATADPSTVGTTIYTLTVNDGSGNSGCSSQSMTTVTVNITPSATATNNGYICNGGTVTLTETGVTSNVANYIWNGTAIVSGSGSPTATADPSTVGTTIYTLTVNDGSGNSGCTSQSMTTVTVNITPSATAGNTGYICNGGTVTLNETGVTSNVANYIWNGTAIVSGSGSPTATADPSTVGTTIYTLTVNDGSGNSGCTSQSMTTVTVNITPSATAGNTGYICNGGTVTLNETGVTSNVANYIWNGTAIVSGSGSPTATADPSTVGTTIYTLTVNDGSGNSGCSSQSMTTVTVNITPSATATNNGYICNGGTVMLSETGVTSNVANYIWNGTAIVSGSGSPTATADPSTVGTTIYTLTVNDGSGNSGCTSQSMTTVTVNITPSATATNNGYICNGGTVTLTETGVTSNVANYIWNGTAITGGSGSPTATADPSTVGTTTYTLTVNDGSGNSGCTSQSMTTVTVNITPSATATNNGYICNGGTVMLSETGVTSNVANYIWNGTAIVSGSGSPTATADPSTVGTTIYTLTVNDGSGNSGCTSQSMTTVTVNITPSATATNNGYICNGGTVTLTETGVTSNVANYIWNGTAITGGSGSPTATADPSTVGTTTYTLTVNDGSGNSGCTSQSMTTVTVNPTPTAAPTNNGYICNGGTVTLAANGLNGAITFAWTGNSFASGTATDTVMAAPTATSVYSVMVTDGSGQSGCSPSTQYTTTVNVNPTPTIDTVINNGYICNGGTVTLGALPSSYNATAFAWMGANLIDTTGIETTATPTTTSTYTVTVSDGSGQPGCSPSTQYYSTVVVHITPSASPTNSSPICIGGTVNLIANETPNVLTYSWSGASLSSSSIADPTATPTVNGVYTLTVSDGSSQPGCSPATQYTTAVTVNGVPSVTVTNNGPVCANDTLMLIASNPANVTDYLWSGPVAVSSNTSATASVPGATTSATGTYTVTVNNGTGSGCMAIFTTQATVNPLPTQYSVTGGGPYCMYDTGVHVGLSGSDIGFSYSLYNSSGLLGTFNGTGHPLDFGLVTIAGTYTVSGNNNTTGCNNNMIGSATVIVNALPNQYAVLSTGTNYCAGHPDIDVLLSNSDTGVKYQLYLGSISTGGAVVGSASSISFGLQTMAGDYMVIATDSTTGCMNTMLGAAEIIIDPLPTVYTVSGSGSYCAGNAGVDITLSGSDTGITYTLMNAGILGGISDTGTGSLINYGAQTDTGAYTVLATNNSTTCTSLMSGSPVITMNPLPAIDTVTGGGAYCEGASGIAVGLNSSTSGINYRLYNGATEGDTVMGVTGTMLNFGPQAAGTYTVAAFNATTGCTSNMWGSAVVSMNPAPALYTVTGIGNYCAGMAGVNIGLSGSDTGVTYTLYNGLAIDSAMEGVAGVLNFGVDTSGNYSIIASNNTTSCTSIMPGGGIVGVNALPVVYDVTGSGSYCAGSGGTAVGVNASNTGVNYYLYDGAVVVDSASGTTGSAINFGLQAAGTYTVNGINASTSCSSNMAGSAVVIMVATVTPSVSVSTGVGDTVCFGNTITFTATPVNGGSTPLYQWYKNAVAVTDTTSIYAYVPANGDVVTAVVMSSAACATPATVSASDTMTVETQATPAVAISADPGTLICTGTVVTFTAMPAYGGTLPVFNWKVNGGPAIAGQVYTYTPANGDNVSVELTSNYTCAIADTASSYVTMSVGTQTAPVVKIIANPGTSISVGQEDTLTAFVTNAGGPLSYQWVVNSTVIPSATTLVYTNTFNNNDSVTCQVSNNNGCNMEGFNSVTITVFQLGINPVTFGTGDIRLVPNPNQGNFSIKGTLGTTADEDITMEVTDILGQVIYHSKVTVHNGIIDEQIQLSNALANGMYMMNLRSGSDSKVIHFVIEQ